MTTIRGFTRYTEQGAVLGILAKSIDITNLPEHKVPKQIRDEIPTLNQFGYMKFELEEFSQSFLDLASKAKNPVLEIGPAYGWFTHKILETGAIVVAQDISKEHLEVLLKDTPEQYLDKLYIYQGVFPDEVDFPENSLEVILVSRVLHFLDGETLEKGLDKIYKWLSANGKLITTNCSIYHSSVKEKLNKVFEKRINDGQKWPGMVLKQDFDSVHDDYSQPFLNTFYKEQLEVLLPQHGFKIEKIKYFDYPSDPWPDEGKGHIGFVATKI